MSSENKKIIPSQLAITALRDSGYKNTAYALAELIDNSQQASASCIEVFCIEKKKLVGNKELLRIAKMAVLDDGTGMDNDKLLKALQFGNGERLNDRTGIGRFGIGLPNASISQAGRVDVWSWTNGVENALHTYIDVKEIESGFLTDVPDPEHMPLPDEWTKIANNIHKTGTLVVWSDLDMLRLTWKRAKSTLYHTGQIVGRVYRKFLIQGSLSIRLCAIEDGNGSVYDNEVSFEDPLYLIPSITTPEPFNKTAMFELAFEEKHNVEYGGESHLVTVKYSVARPETNIEACNQGIQDRGKTKFGKHAGRNIGVSVIRADRELMLDPGWCIGYDPRERWWGAEVVFPPALDEIFGVTNNKQAATHFSELARIDWEQIAENGEDFREVVQRLKDEDDPRGWLLPISDAIRRNLNQLRNILRDQGKGNRSTRRSRHDEPDDLTKAVNKSWKERSKEKPIDDANPTDEDLNEIKNDLKDVKNYTEEEAEAIVSLIRDADLNVVFLEANFYDPYQLFTVEIKGSVTEVTFNRKHPAFDSIFGTISIGDEDISTLSHEEILDKLFRAVNASKILFAAWARYEREAGMDSAKRLEKIRFGWGQIAADFLEPDESL